KFGNSLAQVWPGPPCGGAEKSARSANSPGRLLALLFAVAKNVEIRAGVLAIAARHLRVGQGIGGAPAGRFELRLNLLLDAPLRVRAVDPAGHGDGSRADLLLHFRVVQASLDVVFGSLGVQVAAARLQAAPAGPFSP